MEVLETAKSCALLWHDQLFGTKFNVPRLMEEILQELSYVKKTFK